MSRHRLLSSLAPRWLSPRCSHTMVLSPTADFATTPQASFRSTMRFTSQPRPPLLPRVHHTQDGSDPTGLPLLPTVHHSPMMPPSPPLIPFAYTFDPPALDAPVPVNYGDDDVAPGQLYATTAPDGAIGRAAAYQYQPLHTQLHTACPSPNLHVHPRIPPSLPDLQPATPRQHSAPAAPSLHVSPPMSPPPLDQPTRKPYWHSTWNEQQLPPPQPPGAAPVDVETDMRRAVLTDPFHLFCPAGLATLPGPLTGGAFLPLRFVEAARTRSEELTSGPCWSLYLYGPQEKVVAFCLHEQCVKARQEVNPVKGSASTHTQFHPTSTSLPFLVLTTACSVLYVRVGCTGSCVRLTR